MATVLAQDQFGTTYQKEDGSTIWIPSQGGPANPTSAGAVQPVENQYSPGGSEMMGVPPMPSQPAQMLTQPQAQASMAPPVTDFMGQPTQPDAMSSSGAPLELPPRQQYIPEPPTEAVKPKKQAAPTYEQKQEQAYGEYEEGSKLRQQALDEQRTAVDERGHARSLAADELARKTDEINAATIEARGKADAWRKEQQDKLNADHERIATRKIDQDPFEGSIGREILAGISIMLSRVASGTTQGPNQALEIIDHAIDRKINLQREQIARELGVIDARGRQLVSDVEANERMLSAMTAAKMAEKDALATKLEANVQNASDEITKAGLTDVAGQLRQGSAKDRMGFDQSIDERARAIENERFDRSIKSQQLALQRQQVGADSAARVDAAKAAVMAKLEQDYSRETGKNLSDEDRKKVLTFNGKYIGLANSETIAPKAQEKLDAAENLYLKWQSIRDKQKELGAVYDGPLDRYLNDEKVRAFKNEYMQLVNETIKATTGAGVQKEEAKRIIGSIGSFETFTRPGNDETWKKTQEGVLQLADIAARGAVYNDGEPLKRTPSALILASPGVASAEKGGQGTAATRIQGSATPEETAANMAPGEAPLTPEQKQRATKLFKSFGGRGEPIDADLIDLAKRFPSVVYYGEAKGNQ